MKKIIIYTLLLIITDFCYSQSENWKVLSIQRELYSINFVSQQNGWVFGGDFAYKTSDGGMTWSYPIKMQHNVGMSGGTYFGYPDQIYFTDSLYGWACQNSNILLKTVNGGNNWNFAYTNLNNCKFTCVHFLNRNTGWIAGYISGNAGIIARTTNGGINWTIINNLILGPVNSFQMLSANTGFLAYFNSSFQYTNAIAYTNNGWSSVQYESIGNNTGVKRILFNDTTNGWILGYSGTPMYIARTSNTGQNWSTHTFTNTGALFNLFFLDNYNGWIIGAFGTIQKTSNGGINWSILRDYQGGSPYYDNYDIIFKNNNTGWVSASNGTLLGTSDGGIGWVKKISPPIGTIASIDFIDINTGFIIRNDRVVNNDASFVCKTVNRGYNWSEGVSFVGVKLNSIDVIDNNISYVCGDLGKVYKTTNSGINYLNIGYGGNSYLAVCFLNANTGYICGTGGTIIKTTNGGANWVNQITNVTIKLTDISFVDLENGFASADSGYVLKTTNGGTNWQSLYPVGNHSYNSVQFISSSTGFLVGNRSYSGFPPSVNRVVIKTTDAGLSWSHLLQQNLTGFGSYNDIFFLNSQIGWIVRTDNNTGFISKTTNGGANWFQVFGPMGTSGGYYSGALTKIFSLGEDRTWAGGFNGTILSTSVPVGIQNISLETPANFVLSQNYPNPFNPQTKIKFAIPKASFTKLIIYDLLGREVATLVNEELSPGTYEADWDASNFSSGVYFYKIISVDFVETKKMVLMK